MTDTVNHRINRDNVLDDLKCEMIGPNPRGASIDVDSVESIDYEQVAGPWFQSGSEDEIICLERPSSRYGSAVLNPFGTRRQEVPDREEADLEPEDSPRQGSDSGTKTKRLGKDEPDGYDYDISSNNSIEPSSMGISFLLNIEEAFTLKFFVSGGRYRRKKISSTPSHGIRKEYDWWLRHEVNLEGELRNEELTGEETKNLKANITETNIRKHDLDLEIMVISRPYNYNSTSCRLITVSLVNRSDISSTDLDKQELKLFQSEFSVTARTNSGDSAFLPYPAVASKNADEEEESMALLYSDYKTWAVGHGCAADWINEGNSVSELVATHFPTYDQPAITPDIKIEDQDGNLLELSMQRLASEQDTWILDRLVESYESWIDEKYREIESLESEFHETAHKNLELCRRCISRMKSGIGFLEKDTDAAKAFSLANRAMILQQVNRVKRDCKFKNGRPFYNADKFPDLNPETSSSTWRPFQLAFILMSMESGVLGEHKDRDQVDLIWFPTGGGKTEAYLGLASFIMFYRMLKNPDDRGTSVIMRYTLRLLTAQQFQRASRLICAMEEVRNEITELSGPDEMFSIGIWVGGSTSPNTRKSAKYHLGRLKNNGPYASNKFLLSECPWCGAEMGPGKEKGPVRKYPVLGYRDEGNTIQLFCPDSNCTFHEKLPVYVIDEDIYQSRPSIVIGTVDKFARLSWEENAGALFGLDNDGNRSVSPPDLILQDELHLISGPLGSMVGIYEPMIEKLCTTSSGDMEIKPKIVCSTATIRRYHEQVLALYGRDSVSLFPPPELKIGESFFARYSTDEDGKIVKGKRYVGIHAPGLRSLQTAQVRAFSSLLQSPVAFDSNEARDPWWTLMVFYNSLRELGGALTLFSQDVTEHLVNLVKRHGFEKGQNRQYVNRYLNIRELTGRISSDDVYRALDDLNVKAGTNGSIDACLSSSIMEVGVDIDRLSLLTVIGQPKTTSQYIQVTGRVGRKWERPGLICTLYSPTKPRDRSHFEKFRSYHEKLYAQVEPTSVTPFAEPVLDRALFGVIVSHARQSGVKTPESVPHEILQELRNKLKQRALKIGDDREKLLDDKFNDMLKKWEESGRSLWEQSGDEPGLIHPAGSYLREGWEDISIAVPNSLRSVDAECLLNLHHMAGLDQELNNKEHHSHE